MRLKELHELTDFALVSRLCDNVDLLTAEEEEFWVDVEEAVGNNERLHVRIRDRAARMIAKKERVRDANADRPARDKDNCS